MNDKAKIIAALVVFLVLATFPFWYSPVAGEGPPLPDLPTEDGSLCVDNKNAEWMTAHHMNLLDDWRNEVVRGQGEAGTVTVTLTSAETGETKTKMYPKSLTKTCLDCHTMETHREGKRSCAQCHDYAGVQPRCMDCHVEPKGD